MKKNSTLSTATLLFTLLFCSTFAQQENIVWAEDFEDDWTQNWYVSNGTWEVGVPTSGPDTAHGGLKCAATNLDGYYSDSAGNSSLISTWITIPTSNENPRLRFWHWYSFHLQNNDFGKVQIRTQNNMTWQNVSNEFRGNSSSIWANTYIDLTPFAESVIQIAFYFHSEIYGTAVDEGPGWYIDDLEIITGNFVFNNPEGWEGGISDWWVSDGTWEVGVPVSGPVGAHNGTACVATVLNGNYSDYADNSRFTSPWFEVPPANANPRLRFWHWYKFHLQNNDYGKVQIRTQSNMTWLDVSNVFKGNSSDVWANTLVDLSLYGESTIQIGFYFHSEIYGAVVDEGPGWYIDDIELRTGANVFNNPEYWEKGINDWWVSDGTWEVGIPNSGPNSAYSGLACAATRLNGNYSDYADNSRLTSQWFTVPSASVIPRLTFWHWYSFHAQGNDYGKVIIRTEGGSWVEISELYTGNSNDWINPNIDLIAYANNTVQIAFYFHSEIYGTAVDEGPGWYIDDITIEDFSNLTVDAGSNKTINIGGATTLDASVSGGSPPYSYEWVPAEGLNDPTTLNPQASPSDTTTYTLKVTDANGCFRTDNVTVFVNNIMHFANNKAEINTRIYPNPFSIKTTIEFHNPEGSNYTLSIFGMNGCKVFEMENVTSEKIEFERGNLPKGIYMLELKGEIVFRGKLVIE